MAMAIGYDNGNGYWLLAMEGVSKLNQCGLRSALPLARARKPNNHIAQGSALPFIHIFCSLKSLEFCIFVR